MARRWAISELTNALISMRNAFSCKSEKTLSSITALSFLARAMMSGSEDLGPMRAFCGREPTFRRYGRWVTYRFWNHYRKYEIVQNTKQYQSALFGLANSFSDIPIAFSPDDLSIPMEMSETLTLGRPFSLKQIDVAPPSVIGESGVTQPPHLPAKDISQELFFHWRASSSDER